MLSDTIRVLRLPLLLLVVLIHCNVVYRAENDGAIIAAKIMHFFSKCLCEGAVPLYFSISAYLFFQGIQRFEMAVFVNKWQRRFYTLLIPYLFWNFMGLCVLVAIHSAPLRHYFPGLDDIDLSFRYVLDCFWQTNTSNNFFLPAGLPANGPMWFIRDLMVMNLLAPLIYVLFRKVGRLLVGILLACFVCGIWIRVTGLSILGVLFYSIGAYCSIRNVSVLPRMMSWHFLPCIAIAWSVFDTLQLYPDNWQVHVHAITVLLVFLSLIYAGAHLTKSRCAAKLSTLGQLGFFIFASHMLIAAEVNSAVIMLVEPHSDFSWLMCYVLNLVLLITLPLLAYLALNRFTPRFCAVITGRTYSSSKSDRK